MGTAETTMITYFNLHRPDSELLLGEDENYRKRLHTSCPISSEHSDGSRRTAPLSVTLKHNRREEMMIWCWVEGQVIHKQLVTEFERHGFTGYRTRQAEVRFKDGLVSTDYQELVVTGWAGVASPESGIQVKKSCPACCWKQYTGIANYETLIDWTRWTGEDFFIVWPLPKFVLITERVAMYFLESGIKSFSLKTLDDFDRPVGASGFTVGRLSDFLPEDLAIKYGRPLGIE
jgi:hypothetical protein